MEGSRRTIPVLPNGGLVVMVYDVIVIGAGHAGCEAALAAARIGCKTLLITINLDYVALMPCNPAVGGPGKAHLVREVDALGGEIGLNTDKTFIQMRMLNTAKGPAVRALRAQVDKVEYQRTMLKTLQRQSNLDLSQGIVERVLVSNGRVKGVETQSGTSYEAQAVVLTTGTYLRGRVIVGDMDFAGGPNGQIAAEGLSESLFDLEYRNGNLRGLIIDAAEAGIIKRGWFADTLTKEGQNLLNFMTEHQHELEAQLRRMIRKLPVPRGKYRSVSKTRLKNRQKYYTYSSKVTTSMDDSWLGSIAVPETIITAAKNSILEKCPSFRVKKEDIRVHNKEVSQAVDMCLVLDGSASMVGPKMKAIKYLVEHLFLVTRDKISVVVFQGREARVAVPFTRNYSRLKAGIKSLQPQGLTPLADGLCTSIKLIRNRQVRNPLLILITDGMPTTGKWTINPQQDALRAVEMINETRAKLICIGVASNQEFLEQLADKAKGNVYILDSLEDQATLIEIIHKERKACQS
jgi:Mg-chelatase subunit ChlD